MTLQYFEYIELVKAAYERKRANNELPRFRVQSTPAKLKEEALDVIEKRYDKKDDQTLITFFGEPRGERQFLQLIRKFDTERFKPLNNYLKGTTKKPDDKNLELLAWLIDFKHRPFESDKNVILTDDELAVIKNDIAKEPETTPEKVNDLPEVGEKPKEPLGNATAEPIKTPEVHSNAEFNFKARVSRLKKPILIFLFLVTLMGGVASIIWQQTQHQQTEMGTAFPEIQSLTLQSPLTALPKKDTVGEHLKSVPLKSTVDDKKKIVLPAVTREADRCQAITKKGTRCKRSAKSSGYCLQHVRMVALKGVKATFLKSFLPGTDFQTITCIAMQKRF